MKYRFNEEDYKNAVKQSLSYAGVCRILGIVARGGNYATIKRNIKKYNIDTSHFTGRGWNVGLLFCPAKKYSLEEILKENFPYSSQRLKQRLIEAGLKEKKCECCGLTEWNGKEIPLELHHINGDNTDNRLENLQILCPNCHAQTEHYRGKNQIRYDNNNITEVKTDIELKAEYDKKKKDINEDNKLKKRKNAYIKKEKPKRYCENCGKELTSKQTHFCSQECAHESVSKRPPVIELMEKIKEFNNNMLAIGRYYGVSDTAVRKWKKLYKL